MSKKDDLIKAAQELIDQNGYNDISVEAITKRAKVAKGTFYTYFKQKEDIVSAITIKSFEKIRDHSFLIEGNIVKKISEFFKNVTNEIETIGIEICRAWLASSIKLENVSGLYSLEFYLKTIQDYLKKAVEINELQKSTPIDELTEEIVATFYGLINIWCITNKKINLSNSVNNYCKISLPKILESFC